MLQLIGYDLKEPRDYEALENGVAVSGGGINIMNGPWISGADKSPRKVLAKVQDSLRQADRRGDKLLVVPLGMGEIGTGRKDVLLGRPKKGRKGSKSETDHVLAIAYTLRNRKGRFQISRAEQDRHKRAVKKAVKSFTDQCHPVDALWFVKTKKPAHRVRLDLEKTAPFITKDELMVVDVLRTGEGDCLNLRTKDERWLRRRGVLAA